MLLLLQVLFFLFVLPPAVFGAVIWVVRRLPAAPKQPPPSRTPAPQPSQSDGKVLLFVCLAFFAMLVLFTSWGESVTGPKPWLPK